MRIRRLLAGLAVVVGVLSVSTPAWAFHEGEFCSTPGATAVSDTTGRTMVCSNINADGSTDSRNRWRAQAAAVTTTTAVPADTTPTTAAPVENPGVQPVPIPTTTIPTVTPTPTTVAGMPNTGIDSGRWAGEAASLTALGGVLVVAARRRRRGWPVR